MLRIFCRLEGPDSEVLQQGPMKRFELPTAPASQTGQVKAWSKPVIIPTYHPLPPDKNPMFLDRSIYQGSSGRVYPLPFIDRISTEARERTWQAVHLENEFLRVMVLTGNRRAHPRWG
jgi:hypothetical protein